MMRVNGSCSRNCTACSCPNNDDDDDDEYFGLEFWMIILIGAAAGALVVIIKVSVLSISFRFW